MRGFHARNFVSRAPRVVHESKNEQIVIRVVVQIAKDVSHLHADDVARRKMERGLLMFFWW